MEAYGEHLGQNLCENGETIVALTDRDGEKTDVDDTDPFGGYVAVRRQLVN